MLAHCLGHSLARGAANVNRPCPRSGPSSCCFCSIQNRSLRPSLCSAPPEPHTCHNTGLRSPRDLRSFSVPRSVQLFGSVLGHARAPSPPPVTAPPLLWRPSISPPRPSQTEKKRTGAHPTRCDKDNDNDTLTEDGPNMCSASGPAGMSDEGQDPSKKHRKFV